jgi:hypothetical protein
MSGACTPPLFACGNTASSASHTWAYLVHLEKNQVTWRSHTSDNARTGIRIDCTDPKTTTLRACIQPSSYPADYRSPHLPTQIRSTVVFPITGLHGYQDLDLWRSRAPGLSQTFLERASLPFTMAHIFSLASPAPSSYHEGSRSSDQVKFPNSGFFQGFNLPSRLEADIFELETTGTVNPR